MEEEVLQDLVLVGVAKVLNGRNWGQEVNGHLMTEPKKSVIKFLNRSNGSFLIQCDYNVTLAKDTVRTKLEVNKITNITSTLVAQGMATIESREILILVEEVTPKLLRKFLGTTNKARVLSNNAIIPVPHQPIINNPGSNRKTLKPPTATYTGGNFDQDFPKLLQSLQDTLDNCRMCRFVRTSRTSRGPQQSLTSLHLTHSVLEFPTYMNPYQREYIREELENYEGELTPHKGGVKRPSSPVAMQPNAKKSMVTKIVGSEGYHILQVVLEPSLETLWINAASMKEIDKSILALGHLKHLDLSGNWLTDVNVLWRLDSPLKTLNLSRNRIASLQSNLRFGWRALTSLDLSCNKLGKIPEAFVFLGELKHLNVSHNRLSTLPYNIMYLHSLETLLANDNFLQFLPEPLTGHDITFLDVSRNSEYLHSPTQPWFLSSGIGTRYNQPPTLKELAAETILNRDGGRENDFDKWIPGTLPHNLMNYLYKAKVCYRCGKLSTRYRYVRRVGVQRLLADRVLHDGCDLTNAHFLHTRATICPAHEPGVNSY